MDSNVEPPRSIRIISSKNQAFDIISSLQDDILHHILSFVPTKDVIRTSILSTRWLKLRTSSPLIILVDEPSSSIKISLEVVNRVLTRHHPSDIRRLGLVLSSPVDFSHLELWISIAQNHNVQNLDLNILVEDQFELPLLLYDCRSLVELKLDLNCVLKAPECTQFSGLITLNLSKIIFYNHLSFERLLTNCPVLEELALENCEWKNIESLGVTVPMLKSLIIKQDLTPENILNCLISFCAPNLSSFNCSTNLKIGFCLHDKYLLESAALDFQFESQDIRKLTPRAIKLFCDFQNVKHLSISSKIFMCMMIEYGYGQNFQPFENLTHLEINTEHNPVFIDILLCYLNKVPNLEFLDLAKGIWRIPSFIHDLRESIVPSCFNSSLKKIRIANFEGRRDEMGLLKFLLKNATVLERMLIYFSDELLMDSKRLLVVCCYLEKLPRGSDRLLIYYSDNLLMDMNYEQISDRFLWAALS